MTALSESRLQGERAENVFLEQDALRCFWNVLCD